MQGDSADVGVIGSQNGWNHSGKSGVVNWMYGVLGIANAQRTLEVLRSITEFVSQDQYKDVVTMVGLVNEVQNAVLGLNTILSLSVPLAPFPPPR